MLSPTFKKRLNISMSTDKFRNEAIIRLSQRDTGTGALSAFRAGEK